MILTSATTVFGLAPLLFETSRQAQFLLPTVVTLAYGLAVGLFLVISVTPALLAIQHDVGMAVTSGRRLTKIRGRKPLAGSST
jgi:multidrug efflux pump subunit AcrB